ncbi:MAG: PepSY-associated TM helix domain-containing protein [Acidobacteriota bacterium]
MLGAQFQIQNSGSRVHFHLFRLHRISGVAVGLLLLILGVSGSVMAFSGEIDSLLHPSLFKVVPKGQPLSLSQLASSAASVLHAGESIDTCLPSTRADTSYSFIVFKAHHRISRQIFVDQYTGRVLGSLSAVRFTSIMKALHLIAGGLGCSSIILVFLVLSGLYLWWPRKQIKMSLSGNVQRLSFELHNATGFFASLFLFLFAVTGIYMVFGPPSYAITSKPVKQPAFSTPQVGLKPVSLDLVASAAKNRLPGATVLWIVIPRQSSEAYFVKMRFPEDRSDNGSSGVWISQFSGKVLAVANSRAIPLGNKLQTISRVIHTGAVFGKGGRAFAAFMSLILVLQIVTGLHMWWNRRRRKAPPASASQP